MNVLVTGGCGLVGQAVVTEIKKLHRVRVVDQRKVGNIGPQGFIQTDIRDQLETRKATEGIDAIVHLAAIRNPTDGTPRQIMDTNVMGTFNLLEAAVENKVKKIVLASSVCVAGFVFQEKLFKPSYFPIDEEHPLRPEDPYGLSKLLAEEICKRYTRRFGISSIALRFSRIVGDPAIYSREFSDWDETDSGAKGLWAYVDVRDVAQAIRLALEIEEVNYDSFYITARNTYSKEKTLDLMRRYYPGVPIKDEESFRKDERKALYSISKAERILGYSPKINWRNFI